MLEQKKFDSINCKNRFQNPNKSQNMDVCYRYKHFFLFCCVPELPFVMLTPISVLNKTTDIQIKLHGIRLYLIIVFKHKFGLALSHALNTCAVLWCLFFSHCCLIGKSFILAKHRRQWVQIHLEKTLSSSQNAVLCLIS